jgi:hypothetical protein
MEHGDIHKHRKRASEREKIKHFYFSFGCALKVPEKKNKNYYIFFSAFFS